MSQSKYHQDKPLKVESSKQVLKWLNDFLKVTPAWVSGSVESGQYANVGNTDAESSWGHSMVTLLLADVEVSHDMKSFF